MISTVGLFTLCLYLRLSGMIVAAAIFMKYTGYKNVGIWAWHLISFSDKPPKNFSKFPLVFKEDAS